MLVNNIIPYSNCDGPGNRLVIFVQGCNLNCLYCHNFETINICNNCMACIATCPSGALQAVDNKAVYDESTCTHCDTCVYTCNYNSTPKAKHYTSTELAKMISEYADFIDGVTFSGGECTLYHQEILEVLNLIEDYNINVLLDSNGYFDVNELSELIDKVDGFMIDLKTLNHSHSLIGTQDSNLANIDYLIHIDKLAELRTVDLHDSESKLTKQYLQELVDKHPKIRLKINPLSTSSLSNSRLEALNTYINK